MMKRIILGTSGHIDHGKTSLVKALTGTDTDRLKEEKRRGITIELGFASFAVSGELQIGIVDVPGHEKFVKNMVAGASGIDIVAMVIAADEGVMPQTREHMEICTLLGVRHGLVVLTKIDTVDEEWLEMVTDDIKGFVQGTFLEGSPVIPVSSVTGEGLDLFTRKLAEMGGKIEPKSQTGIFRLPIDRVFTMKGFGTVITGTVISGSVRVGDAVTIYPSETLSKIRGIQVHGGGVDEAGAGMRTAVNFQGLERELIGRGDVLASKDSLKPSYMLDLEFTYLAGNKKALKNRRRVRFHTGTCEIMGILILLEDEIAPGETAVVQIRLDAPVCCIKDDRFVVRDRSPVVTIGGGRILNPVARKYRGAVKADCKSLVGLGNDDTEAVILFHAKKGDASGIPFSDFAIMTNSSGKSLEKTVQRLLSARKLVCCDRERRLYLHGDVVNALLKRFSDALAEYHGKNPLKVGISKEELRTRFFREIDRKVFETLLTSKIKVGEIVEERDLIRLASHKASLKDDQPDIRGKIIKKYGDAGLSPPYLKEVAKDFSTTDSGVRDIFGLMEAEGLLVKVSDELYFHTDSIEDLKKRVIAFLTDEKEMTTPQFKDIARVSRKYLIPLLEYFDRSNVTIRVEDIRVLRG